MPTVDVCELTKFAASRKISRLVMDVARRPSRATEDQIHLEPFTLAECEAFSNELGHGLTRDEIGEYYMVFGGVPYYWSLLWPGLSVAENIDSLFFAPQGKLREEYGFLYASLFRNFDSHLKIVEALAEKPYGMTRDEICAATGLAKGGSLKTWHEELGQCGTGA